MRLINADALKLAIPETSVDAFQNCRNCVLLDKEQVNELIDVAPTIDIDRPTRSQFKRMAVQLGYEKVVRKPVKGYEGYYEIDQFGRVFGYGTKTKRQAEKIRGRVSEKRVPVIQMSMSGEFIAGHPSIAAAAESVGSNSPSDISACCRGQRKSHCGYKWEFDGNKSSNGERRTDEQ